MSAAQFTLHLNNCHVNNAARLALIDQGLDTCDSFLGFNDGDMRAVCRKTIQPGGTLPGRGAAAGRANRGTPVTFASETNLRKACFHRNYMNRIQRTFVAATATMILVQDVWDYRFDLENPDRDVEREVIKDPAPMVKVDDIVGHASCRLERSVHLLIKISLLEEVSSVAPCHLLLDIHVAL